MESTNKNVRFVLNLGDVDVFIFNPLDCLWDNHLMGEHNGIKEWCVNIYNPVGRDIELFCKEGDVVVIETFVNIDGDIVAKTGVNIPWSVATNVLYGYDELLEDNVSLESCFTIEENDEEPSIEEILAIDNEVDELIKRSQTLTIEELLEDEEYN